MSAENHGCLRTVLWIVGIIIGLQILSGILGGAFTFLGSLGDDLFDNEDEYEENIYDDENMYDGEYVYDEYVADRLDDYYNNLNKEESITYSVYVDWGNVSGGLSYYQVGRYDERVLTEDEIPQNTGARFEGLFSQPNGGIQYVNAAGYLIHSITEDINLYAVYTTEPVGTGTTTDANYQ